MPRKVSHTEKHDYEWYSSDEDRLFKAIESLKNTTEVANFMRDLLTPGEMEEFANRLKIANLLEQGSKSYIEIAREAGTSTTTVTRVAQWLYRGHGGYQTALSRLDNPKSDVKKQKKQSKVPLRNQKLQSSKS